MPIYEYACLKCKKEYQEIVMSDGEEKKVKCPKCGSKRKEKIISSFAIVSDLCTDMPKPDLSGLPEQVRNKVQLSDYIEEKDRPKANR